MSRRKVIQTNFSAGELAPDLSMRSDTDQHQNGAKSLRNRRCLIGGGTVRRPGLKHLNAVFASARTAEFIVDQNTQYTIAFSAGRFEVYRLDGTQAASVTNCPWNAIHVTRMDWVQTGSMMIITDVGFAPRVILFGGDTSWSQVPFAFYTSGPRTEQPYLKFRSDTLTIGPSALTGAIVLTANGTLFNPNHVGTIFRYLGREILITSAAVDGLTATATVLEALPGTFLLTVTSSADFTVGEIVAGATSGAKGVVYIIPDATHLIVYLRSLSTITITDAGPQRTRKRTTGKATVGSRADSGSTGDASATTLQGFTTETLVGPSATTAISASAATTPASVTDWDEQLFAASAGFPSCVAIHRGRLIFAGHPAMPGAIIASTARNAYSFDVGDGSDGDAIFETIGDGLGTHIVQMFSAEQLIVATDRGLYYCPEGASNPFRPSSIAFYPFGSPWPINGSVKMRAFDNGVIAVSGSTVIKARPTGDNNNSWGADEVSLLSSHLIKSPVHLATTTNFDGGPERYMILVNADGTLAVGQLVEAQKIRNFVPWDTNGTFLSVSCAANMIFAVTKRRIGGVDRFYFEKFVSAETLDLAATFPNGGSLDGIPTSYGVPVKIVTETGFSLGDYPPTAPELPAGPFHVGLDYVSEIELLPPVVEDSSGSHAGEMMRITETLVFVTDSYRFAQNGYELAAYQVIDPLDQPPPPKSGPQRFTNLGWRRDPTVRITQPDPLPLKVLAVKTTVAY